MNFGQGVFEFVSLKCRLDEKGQGIVEYAILLAFVVVIAVVIGSGGLKEKVSNSFDNNVELYDKVEEG